MGRFIREFVEFEIATEFARAVNAEVVVRYDWNSYAGCIVKTYRVTYSVS